MYLFPFITKFKKQVVLVRQHIKFSLAFRANSNVFTVKSDVLISLVNFAHVYTFYFSVIDILVVVIQLNSNIIHKQFIIVNVFNGLRLTPHLINVALMKYYVAI